MIHTNLWESSKNIEHRTNTWCTASHQGESTSTNTIHPGYLLKQSEAILGAPASQEGCPWDTSREQLMWAHHGCRDVNQHISMLLAHLTAYPIRHAFPSLRISNIGHFWTAVHCLYSLHNLMMIHTNLWESGKSIEYGTKPWSTAPHQGESTSTNPSIPGTYWYNWKSFWGHLPSQEGCIWGTSWHQLMWPTMVAQLSLICINVAGRPDCLSH